MLAIKKVSVVPLAENEGRIIDSFSTQDDKHTNAPSLNAVSNITGDLSNLTTTNKNSLVGATNEIKSEQNNTNSLLGDLSNLDTAEKSSLVGAVNELVPVELYSSVSGESGEITLSDDIENYKRVDIIANGHGILSVVSIFPQDNINTSFRLVSSNWSTGIVVTSKLYTCSENKITPSTMSNIYINTSKVIEYVRSDLSQDSWLITIHKVIGYK